MRFYVRGPWLVAIPLYALAAGLVLGGLVLAALVWVAVQLLAALAFALTLAVMWVCRRRLLHAR